MNKLMGFFELKHSGLPTIKWNEFNKNIIFDEKKLWSIRSALYHGNDLNLPRRIGATAKEAWDFACSLSKELQDKGIVIYYPYFIAEKSGTLEVNWNETIIEAVKDDLWNMVTYSDRDVTLRYIGDDVIIDGNPHFLDENELSELLKNANHVKRLFRNELIDGQSILLEWSFAYDCDSEKKAIGNKYLVFYEARTV